MKMSIFAEGTNGLARSDMELETVMVKWHILVKKPEITWLQFPGRVGSDVVDQ